MKKKKDLICELMKVFNYEIAFNINKKNFFTDIASKNLSAKTYDEYDEQLEKMVTRMVNAAFQGDQIWI